MMTSKIVVASFAALALTFGGVAQAEAIRAGASLPVAKSAKLSRKSAKKGVELNIAPAAVAPVVIGAAVASVVTVVAITSSAPAPRPITSN